MLQRKLHSTSHLGAKSRTQGQKTASLQNSAELFPMEELIHESSSLTNRRVTGLASTKALSFMKTNLIW